MEGFETIMERKETQPQSVGSAAPWGKPLPTKQIWTRTKIWTGHWAGPAPLCL